VEPRCPPPVNPIDWPWMAHAMTQRRDYHSAKSAADAVIDARQRSDDVVRRVRRAHNRCRISKELAERSQAAVDRSNDMLAKRKLAFLYSDCVKSSAPMSKKYSSAFHRHGRTPCQLKVRL